MSGSDLATLQRLPKRVWPEYLAALGPERKEAVLAELQARKIAKSYQHDPAGYIQGPLDESIWSMQVEICEAVRDHERVAVPACHAPGKSHLAARIIAWWIQSNPVGTALAVTTATTFRQVRNILWPHIRRLHDRHDLPGRCNLTEWWIGEELVAYGFSAKDSDPEAVQGIHAAHLLILIDEAAGISHSLGQAFESLMSGDHVRMLLLGNPPTDNEGTWFEQCCESSKFHTIYLSAEATPNWTGEHTDDCKACPPGGEPHTIAKHLIPKKFAQDIADEWGEDSPMYLAKVLAKFPKGVSTKTIPQGWVERALKNDNPWEGTLVTLGVDIAADGGDEVVVARRVGHVVDLPYINAGLANANAVDVAAAILPHIQEACKINTELGNEQPVRVKIDSIGVGWGVWSILDRWGLEGQHNAVMVEVKAGEKADDPDKFINRRAEMWWNGRLSLAPVKDDQGEDGGVKFRFRMETKSAAQLSLPNYRTETSGKIRIERKVEMKARGVSSPDRAEAILLALYEPGTGRKRKARLIL